ncbi:TPA: DMT family transporter [Candidatus Poribacteria bacterium]|nr:DMT family transporter [Candidatus Poribacteria bacterium]
MEFHLNQGDIFAILTALCWSSGVIFFQVSGRILGSLQISLLKNIIGVIGFIGFLAVQGDEFPLFTYHDLWIMIISGTFGVAVGDLFFLASLRRLGAGLNAIVSTAYSPTVFLLAFFMFGEVISLQAYFGGVLVITGIIIGTLEIPKDRGRENIAWGVLYGFTAQALTAFSVLLLKPIMETHPVVPIALVRFSTGALLSIGFLVFAKGLPALRETMKQGFKHPPLIMGSILGTFLSVIFWLAGYKYTLAGRAAIYNQLSTIFIILLAAIFLKEAMTRRKWLAVSCALSGALLVSVY